MNNISARLMVGARTSRRSVHAGVIAVLVLGCIGFACPAFAQEFGHPTLPSVLTQMERQGLHQIAVDAAGTVYVARGGLMGGIEVIPPHGCQDMTCVQRIDTGTGGAEAVAVDAQGDVYVAGTTGGGIYRYPKGCFDTRCRSEVKVPLPGNPDALAVDGFGTLVAAFGDSPQVLMFYPDLCPDPACTVPVGAGYQAPASIAIGPMQMVNGGPLNIKGGGKMGFEILVADAGANAVLAVPLGCNTASCSVTIGGGFSAPHGVAAVTWGDIDSLGGIGAVGTVYVADTGHNAVKMVPSGCSEAACVQSIGGVFDQPESVAVDRESNVYVALHGGAVQKIPHGCTSAACVVTLTPRWLAPLQSQFRQPAGGTFR